MFLLKKTTATNLLATSLLSVALLTGCGSKPKKSEVGTATAEAISKQLVSTMASAMAMALKMAEESNSEPAIKKSSVTCMINHDSKTIVSNLQKFLLEKFSLEEMKELNDYFTSPAGKKQMEMTSKMLDSLMGGDEKFSFADMQKFMSEEEMKAMGEFTNSEVGQKLSRELQNQADIKPFMEPYIKEIEKDCGIKA